MSEENLNHVEKIEKAARSAGGLFDNLVDWWENNTSSWHRFLAVIAAGGTIGILACAGYGVYHIRFIGNECSFQEFVVPSKP